jgi:hypothetical protein
MHSTIRCMFTCQRERISTKTRRTSKRTEAKERVHTMDITMQRCLWATRKGYRDSGGDSKTS